MKKRFLLMLLLLIVFSIQAACSTENENQKTQKPVKDKIITQNHEINKTLPNFNKMEKPSIKKINNDKMLEALEFDNSYSEVCWNNCATNNIYNYPDIHSGSVEPGNKIVIDWGKMEPKPIEVNLMMIDPINGKELSKESKDTTNTPLEIEIDESYLGSQFAVEFLWKDKEVIQGRSMLNFRLE
ncbi:hypothetical protein [Metabacillus schmidteae]|uniref:hypothetical protein n=1 Tax=Metabacillus schmidteae TaxID=2730405 RepID=UPI00158ED909|nr:hypothetical protein [Metabacillus schmidteae]